METITPNSERQGAIIKALLEEMKVRFTTHPEEPKVTISEAAMKSIQKGIEDADNGRLISAEEAHKIFQDVLNQVD